MTDERDRGSSMDVLLIAPNPFFQERGTPIAVRMLCKTLIEGGHSVDLLTYHVGADQDIPGLTIYRIPKIPFIRDVPIGFSWRKIVCDTFLCAKLAVRVFRKRYHVIHAVEEAIFPALLASILRRTKLVYDMDSSMADQLIEKWALLRWLSPVLHGFERVAIRGSDLVVAVCEDLGTRTREISPDKNVIVLQDFPLEPEPSDAPVEDLRKTLNIDGLLGLYVGNLEHYQGIDLLLEGFSKADLPATLDLVIVGGDATHIEAYGKMAEDLGINGSTHFVGPRPISRLSEYLEQASILFSPRASGNNTPMKIYSYLAAGRPILATNIRSHTQVLDASTAVLVDPDGDAIARGIERLAGDASLREQLGADAKKLVESKYSVEAYKNKLWRAYSNLGGSVS